MPLDALYYRVTEASNAVQKKVERPERAGDRDGGIEEDWQLRGRDFSERGDGAPQSAIVGDKLVATLTPEGEIQFTPYDPDFEKAMEVARRGMRSIATRLPSLRGDGAALAVDRNGHRPCMRADLQFMAAGRGYVTRRVRIRSRPRTQQMGLRWQRLPEMAAAYGYGIARNPPFIDGNKRTSLLVDDTPFSV